MRKLLLAAVAAIALASAPVLADGPSGSTEKNASGSYTNNVNCSGGTETPAATVYAGANGVEVCNDGTTVPVQGRIIATTDQGGYIAADGDRDNTADPRAQGWARIDGNGVRCGDDAGRLDATAPTDADTMEDCG